jgi:hypothetical protein
VFVPAIRGGFSSNYVEVVEYRGIRLAIRQTPLDWLAFILVTEDEPVIVSGSDSECVVALASAWVDENTLAGGERV